MTGMIAAIVWLVIGLVFFVVESATYQLVCIWFVAGSLGALLAALFGAGFTVQMWIFLISSVLFLIFARPVLKKRIKVRQLPTNADRVIGMAGTVLETVDNLAETGRVHANGLSWSARARDDAMRIPAGSNVRVLSIDGVKLIVEPLMEPRNTPISQNIPNGGN